MNEKVEEQPQPNIQITIQDLMVLRSVIDAATKGGVLGAGDLTTVGMVHDKVHVIIEEFMAKQKEAQEAEATAPPVEGEVKEENGSIKRKSIISNGKQCYVIDQIVNRWHCYDFNS